MKNKETDIRDILPFTGFEDGALITGDGDVSVLFRLRLPEVYSLGKDEYSTIHSLWCKALKMLPESVIVHKQDSFFRSRYFSQFDEKMSELERKHELHFNEREFLDHDCILTLTLCTEQRLRGESNFSTLCRKSIIPRDIDKMTVAAFLDSVENFRAIISSTKYMEAIRLSEEEIIGTSEQKGVLERYISLGYEDCGNVTRDIDFSDGDVRVGERKVLFYTIPSAEMLPAYTAMCTPVGRYSTETANMYLSFASPLAIGCMCSHIYNQYIFIERNEKTLLKFEALLRNMRSLSGYSRKNRINAELLENFLDKCRTTGERVIKAHYSMMAWSCGAEEERLIRNTMTAAAGSIGAAAHYDTVDAPLLYWAGIPGNAADFPSEEAFYTFTPQAVTMFSQETVYRDSKATFGIKLSDRDSGRPLMVDLSDLPMKNGEINNRNKFVIGPSGSGKSFFMNHLLRSYYDLGAYIVLIDIGGSYKGLCRMIQRQSDFRDGCYNECSDGTPYSFNPFVQSSTDQEKLENVKALMISLWKKDCESVGMLEENFMGNMVTEYMKTIVGETGCFDQFYNYVKSYKGELRDIARNFINVMKQYYLGGRYGMLLNYVQSAGNIENRFRVYELDGIKDNPTLMTVASIYIMDEFISMMKLKKGVRKVLVIDEAWKALATERMAVYIKYLYKTIRKHFGEVIIVTQEIDDVLSSGIVRESIVNNSDCRILMDQSKYMNRFEELRAALGLSEKQKAEILSINRSPDPKRPHYKELWIGLGSTLSRVYSLEVSKEEYYTYTTEETEKKRVEDMANTIGDYARAVEIIAEESK